MKIISFFLCTMIVFFAGCKQTLREELVSGGKFWDHYDPVKGYVVGSYSFSKEGASFYYTKNAKGERSKIYDDDIVLPHTWELKNDTLINIQGYDRRIISLRADTLLLENLVTKDTMILIKEK